MRCVRRPERGVGPWPTISRGYASSSPPRGEADRRACGAAVGPESSRMSSTPAPAHRAPRAPCQAHVSMRVCRDAGKLLELALLATPEPLNEALERDHSAKSVTRCAMHETAHADMNQAYDVSI